MVEALDTEIGRLVAAIDLSDTTVIFVCDNGSQWSTMEPPFSASPGKGTVYEGGVNVPLIVAGQAVAPSRQGEESEALVQAPDLFAAVLEIAGVAGEAQDSRSLVPHLQQPGAPPRAWVYTEMFVPHPGPPDPEHHHRAVRNARYKLVRKGLEPDELYDLEVDPFENSPLDLANLTPTQQAVYAKLDVMMLSVAWSAVPALGRFGHSLLVAGLVLAVWLASRRRGERA
jgi:arylsulfatase A-like enzyme